MPRFLVYAMIFSAGAACGVALTVHRDPIGTPGATSVSPTEESEAQANVRPLEQSAYSSTVDDLEDTQDTVSGVPSTETMADIATNNRLVPQIPGYYRATIGPVPQHVTFGERYRVFETESIDEPWAFAMEAGINDLIANHGPGSGEVVEFVQCRYSYCALAGYTHDGQEPRGASAIGQLSKQPWWQGSRAMFVNYTDENGRTSFVVLIPRFED